MSMEAKELTINEFRIGNIVDPKYTGEQFSITHISRQKAGDGNYDSVGNADRVFYMLEHINPIPLTEEWLIKFGWGRSDEHELSDNSNEIVFCYDFHFKVLILEDNNGNIGLKNIQYVHQLQNLYFALTGKELEIA